MDNCNIRVTYWVVALSANQQN